MGNAIEIEVGDYVLGGGKSFRERFVKPWHSKLFRIASLDINGRAYLLTPTGKETFRSYETKLMTLKKKCDVTERPRFKPGYFVTSRRYPEDFCDSWQRLGEPPWRVYGVHINGTVALEFKTFSENKKRNDFSENDCTPWIDESIFEWWPI